MAFLYDLSVTLRNIPRVAKAVVTLGVCIVLWIILQRHFYEPAQPWHPIAPGLAYERNYEPALRTWVSILTVDLRKIEPVVVTSSRGMTERDPLTTLAAGDVYTSKKRTAVRPS